MHQAFNARNLTIFHCQLFLRGWAVLQTTSKVCLCLCKCKTTSKYFLAFNLNKLNVRLGNARQESFPWHTSAQLDFFCHLRDWWTWKNTYCVPLDFLPEILSLAWEDKSLPLVRILSFICIIISSKLCNYHNIK